MNIQSTPITRSLATSNCVFRFPPASIYRSSLYCSVVQLYLHYSHVMQIAQSFERFKMCIKIPEQNRMTPDSPQAINRAVGPDNKPQ